MRVFFSFKKQKPTNFLIEGKSLFLKDIGLTCVQAHHLLQVQRVEHI